MKPIDVCTKNEELILKSVYNIPKIFPKHTFLVGDLVRVSKYKGVFMKGYEPNWTTEVFKVLKVKSTHPVTYEIQDYMGTSINGSFYEEELQKVKDKNAFLVEKILKRKNNQVLVKWSGFDSSHDSWISVNDLLK